MRAHTHTHPYPPAHPYTREQSSERKATKMNENETIYIGIDPDVDKNGVATLTISNRQLDIKNRTFPETIAYLQQASYEAQTSGWGFKIIIEAGWMNHGNYHLRMTDGRQASAAKGVSQGRNEQTSRLLGEMCEYHGMPYEFKRPLPKTWKGKDRKITHEELEQVTNQKLKRTNQEGRDAALLAWDKAGFPMRVKIEAAKLTAKARKT